MLAADRDVAHSPEAASGGREAGRSRVHHPHGGLIREAAPRETECEPNTSALCDGASVFRFYNLNYN